ncbi:MAG: DUF6210 family protein [Cyanobacteria bacterium J06638_20]
MSSAPIIQAELQEFDGVCFIVGYESGVEYTHQCGGLSCEQRKMQGFLVPCPQSIPISEQLYAHFYTGPKYKGHCYKGLDEEDAVLIDDLLASVGYDPLSVDRDLLKKSVEAWVYLKISPTNPCFPYCYNSDPASSVVMVWENSD